MRIAVIGSEDFALGFRVCGIKRVILAKDDDFAKKFNECFEQEDLGVIIVEESLYSTLPGRIKKRIEKTISPVVIPLSTDLSESTDLKYLIKRCIGIDLWKEEKEVNT